MVISSRTPEGQPNGCPICRKAVVMEPSQPFGDAPCPHCGCLLHFEPIDEGFLFSVAEQSEAAEDSWASRPEYVCPGCKTGIPFGTETQPPPGRCPVCRRRLSIPTTLSPEQAAKLCQSAGQGACQPAPADPPNLALQRTLAAAALFGTIKAALGGRVR